MTDIRYLAGLFDGEGSISIAINHRKRYSRAHNLSVSVPQNNRSLLEGFKERWGGQIYKRPEPRSHVWQIESRSAYRFLRDITPHLRLKKYLGILGMNFQEECFGHRSRGQKLTEGELVIRDIFKELVGAENKKKYEREV